MKISDFDLKVDFTEPILYGAYKFIPKNDIAIYFGEWHERALCSDEFDIVHHSWIFRNHHQDFHDENS